MLDKKIFLKIQYGIVPHLNEDEICFLRDTVKSYLCGAFSLALWWR